MKAKISEIFKSIQGEGLYQGYEQIFVRFFGCFLNCRFCDTKITSYREYSVEGLTEAVNSHGDVHSISLTGGEPLEQVAFLKKFLKIYNGNKKKIYLETNGILYNNLKDIIQYLDIISMDFKLSSSTGMKDFWYHHREFLKVARSKELFIKAVITNATLIDDVRIALAIVRESKPDATLILQPENPYEDDLRSKLSYFMKICDESSIRVKVMQQMHKKIGVK